MLWRNLVRQIYMLLMINIHMNIYEYMQGTKMTNYPRQLKLIAQLCGNMKLYSAFRVFDEHSFTVCAK